jgi:hypothetical protein
MRSEVKYRREILRNILTSDPRTRVQLECINTPVTNNTILGDQQRNLICDRLAKGDWDILLTSSPDWLGSVNGRPVAELARLKNKFIVYDLSDNWENSDLSIKLMRMSNFVGTSSRYLAELAEKNCPRVGFYPNGVRLLSTVEKNEESDDFKTDAKYVYCGRLAKLDLFALDKLLALDPQEKVDIYGVDYPILGELYRKYINSRVRIFDRISYEQLQKRLGLYQIGLVFFCNYEKTRYGMLPDKYFDYCYAGLPTIYTNCTELEHDDFKKTAFNLNDSSFKLNQIKVEPEELKTVCNQYNMRNSLKKFVNDMISFYYDENKAEPLDRTWTPPWK